MRRGIWIGAVMLIAAVWLPAGAGAANLTRGPDQINFTALAGETNNLVVSRDGADYVFAEVTGVPISPVAPCVNAGASVGRCPAAGIERIDISLANQDDTLATAPSISPPIEAFQVFGGSGTDTLTGGPNVKNNMQGEEGNDTLTAGQLNDDLSGSDGVDTLTSGPGNDILRVDEDAEADTVAAGPGDDSIQLGATGPDGPDSLSGGPGRDRLDLRNRRDPMTITLNGIADDGAGCPGLGCEGDNYGADIEDWSLGSAGDRFTGAAGTQSISGGGGNDELDGAGGSDEVFGSDGDDTMQGGGGNDSVGGSDGSDRLLGGGGDDYLYLADLFDGDRDLFDGGSGFDETGGGSESFFGLRIDVDGRADDGPRGAIFDGLRDNVRGSVEGLEGTERADILIGNRRPNEIEGLGGADRLIGNGGADGIDGGRGGDRIVGGTGRDSLAGGGGADRIRSRDKSPDEVSCGSAGDLVEADRRDRAGADCDRVRRR